MAFLLNLFSHPSSPPTAGIQESELQDKSPVPKEVIDVKIKKISDLIKKFTFPRNVANLDIQETLPLVDSEKKWIKQQVARTGGIWNDDFIKLETAVQQLADLLECYSSPIGGNGRIRPKFGGDGSLEVEILEPKSYNPQARVHTIWY